MASVGKGSQLPSCAITRNEDEDPLVVLDYDYLKRDGTEDDELNKLLNLVAKDVKTGTYAATCLRDNEYATSWMVSLLRRLGYRRATLQSHGEPSTVVLKTATLLAAPSVELVLCESPVGEQATNGVAESAMRAVMRQTRTLKFALEANVGKTAELHTILRWMPMMDG